MTARSSLDRFIAWCGSFLVTIVTFVALAERWPRSTVWIGACLVVAALLGAAAFPAVERTASASRTVAARLTDRCRGTTGPPTVRD